MKATRDSCSSGSNSREPTVVPDLTAGAVRIFQDHRTIRGSCEVDLAGLSDLFLTRVDRVSDRGRDLCVAGV